MNKRLRKALGIGLIVVVALGIGAVSVHHTNAKSHIRIHRVVHHKIHKSKQHKQRKQIKRPRVKKNIQQNHKKIMKANWKNGVPYVLKKNSFWISDYERNGQQKGGQKYVKYSTPLSYKSGFNFSSTYYNSHHKQDGMGTEEGVDAGINPHYFSLGHNYYEITSGSKGKNILHHELYGTVKRDYGGTVLVKINGINNITVWSFTNNKPYGNKKLIGNFNRYPHNAKEISKALGM